MRNYVQPGNVVTVTAPANVKSGDVVAVGSLIGVAAYDALIGAEVEVALTGVFDLPAVGPIDALAAVYWDGAAGKVTAADSGTTLIGAALAAVGEAGTTARVRLNGVAVATS